MLTLAVRYLGRRSLGLLPLVGADDNLGVDLSRKPHTFESSPDVWSSGISSSRHLALTFASAKNVWVREWRRPSKGRSHDEHHDRIACGGCGA
jgi:hypothetical protein